jgi:hypothetical protein
VARIQPSFQLEMIQRIRKATIDMTFVHKMAPCIILALAVAVVLQGAATAAPASLLGANLVVNGNAEAGPALPKSVGAQGWATAGHFTAVNYGYDGYPNSLSPGPSDRGYRLFSGGSSDALSTASQAIDISSLAPSIDAGKIHYNFSAWIGGFSSQRDYATVTATFYNASHASLNSVQIGPVTSADRQGITALLRRQSTGTVPAGSRTIGVKVVATRFEGANNDGYTDNISLTLSQR